MNNHLLKNHVLIPLVLGLLIMTSISVNGNVNSITADTGIVQNDDYDDVRVYTAMLQIRQPGTDHFFDVNPSLNIVPEIRNGSTARFVATLSNVGNTPIFFKGVDILIFNETDKSFTDISHRYSNEIVFELGTNSTQMIDFKRELHLPVEDHIYTVYYSIVYTTDYENQTLNFYAQPDYNFSIRLGFNEIQPPEFIVWGWYLVSISMVTFVVFGFFGNRKYSKNY